MIFEIEIHNDSVLCSLIGRYLVESFSGEVAAAFAIARCKKDYPEEKHLHVKSVREVSGLFIGKAS